MLVDNPGLCTTCHAVYISSYSVSLHPSSDALAASRALLCHAAGRLAVGAPADPERCIQADSNLPHVRRLPRRLNRRLQVTTSPRSSAHDARPRPPPQVSGRLAAGASASPKSCLRQAERRRARARHRSHSRRHFPGQAAAAQLKTREPQTLAPGAGFWPPRRWRISKPKTLFPAHQRAGCERAQAPQTPQRAPLAAGQAAAAQLKTREPKTLTPGTG